VPLLGAPAAAHKLYLVNDNHTDYGWNATTDAYDAAMLGELDYYLARIAATAGNPPAEQSRFNCDNWYYLYLYEKNRSPAEFQTLISRILDGHITAPLNPFVELYGGMPTEAAIRAGYYPGKIERLYGTPAARVTVVYNGVDLARFHPDNRESGDAQVFRQITEAFEILGQPTARAAYDVKHRDARRLTWKIFDQAASAQGIEAEKRKRFGVVLFQTLRAILRFSPGHV